MSSKSDDEATSGRQSKAIKKSVLIRKSVIAEKRSRIASSAQSSTASSPRQSRKSRAFSKGRSRSVAPEDGMSSMTSDDYNELYADYVSSDDDDAGDDASVLPPHFDEVRVRRKLLHFDRSVHIVLSPEQQHDMGIEVGVHVTAEHPWRQLRKAVLLDNMSNDTPESIAFRQHLSKYADDELVLVGFASELSDEQDTFQFFETTEAAQEAGILIRQLEAADRRRARRAQFKRPRHWVSLGSEREMVYLIERERPPRVDVEIECMYPMAHHAKPTLSMRRMNDAKDGYAELVPKRPGDFVNTVRKHVDMAVQSSEPLRSVEQQTDPQFRANAWTQYLYELDEDQPNVADDNNDDDAAPVMRKKKKGPNIPVIPSERVQDMINQLEFNEINMYRNDYEHLADEAVQKFDIPYLTEAFCFVDMAKSIGRVVSAMDWHPVFSGLVVVAYSFDTSSSAVLMSEKIDTVSRTTNEHNQASMWSFDDKLYPKLELETSREIVALSFCPYDENLLIGGTSNGQLTVWDLQDRLEQIETEEVLTTAQARYRLAMSSFLDWTKRDAGDRIVRPVALSSLEHSPRAAITSIRWLPRNAYVSATGLIKIGRSATYRYVVTASLDGTVAFWNMDFIDENAAKASTNAARKLKLPAHMMDDLSEYAALNGVFRPQFVIVYNRPLNALMIDSGQFSYEPIFEEPDVVRKFSTRTLHRIEHVEYDTYDGRIVAGTMLGSIVSIQCEGSEMTSDVIKREIVKQPERYAQIHDGIVQAIARNPFVKNLFLSVGRNMLVLWRLDMLWTPIFWRRCTAILTDVCWSNSRPSVFFVTRKDGSLEAWDILSRIDAPCVKDSLGGSNLTCVTQHRLSLPVEAIAVGDFNSSVRVFQIPEALTGMQSDELQSVIDYAQREVDRKDTLKRWQDHYYACNANVRAAKAQSAQEAALELERLEKEAREVEETRLKREETELRRQRAKERTKVVFDMPDRLEKKWDEMNIKRLMRILMAKKQVDPQMLAKWTAPEKLRQKYDEEKREAIAESFRQTADDLAALRATLIPVEVPDEERINYVKQNIGKIMLSDTDEALNYAQIESEAHVWIERHCQRDALDIAHILRRGRERRKLLNQTLGPKTERLRASEFEERLSVAALDDNDNAFARSSVPV